MALPADPDRGFSGFSVVLVGFWSKTDQNASKPTKTRQNDQKFGGFIPIFTIFVVFVLFCGIMAHGA